MSISEHFVMLGPNAEALFFPGYVRSVSGDFVMLGPMPEAHGDACYVRLNLNGSWKHLLC